MDDTTDGQPFRNSETSVIVILFANAGIKPFCAGPNNQHRDPCPYRGQVSRKHCGRAKKAAS
jgi:hypothetical protein